MGHLYGENAHGWHALVAELSMLAMGESFLIMALEYNAKHIIKPLVD